MIKRIILWSKTLLLISSILFAFGEPPINTGDKLKDAEAYNNRGAEKHNKNYDDNGAIQDYNKAIELNPNLSVVYCNRSLSNARIHNYAGAIQDLVKAIKLNAEYAKTIYNQSIFDNLDLFPSASQEDSNVTSAMQEFNKAIEAAPKDAIIYYLRGLAYSYTHTYISAIEDFNKTIKLNPKFTEAYFYRGLAKVNYNEIAKAYYKNGLTPDVGIYNYEDILSDYKKAEALGETQATIEIRKLQNTR